MRLSDSEICQIKRTTREVWGPNMEIFLFGSRTDDSKKGGDIDLFIDIRPEQDPRNIMLQKAEFLSKLEILLGEQKIDLLVGTPYNNHLPIIQAAHLNGIPL